MIKSSADGLALLGFAVIFSPALYGLAAAAIRYAMGSVDAGLDGFKSGVAMQIANALLSPGVPAYLLYEDMRIGGGSMGSVLSLFILPVTWIIFFAAQKRVSRASTNL